MASLARVGMGALMAGGVAVTLLGLGSAPAQAQTTDGGAPPPTTVHGANFLVKSQLDETFCINVAGGTAEGRTLSLAACSTADTERFAFTWNNDETNSVVDIQGMCVDARNRKANDGKPVQVMKCRFGDAWRFSFTAAGQIRDVKNGKCLAVPGAAANAAVVLVDCDATKKGQLWKVTR